jgi:hypothetical protein
MIVKSYDAFYGFPEIQLNSGMRDIGDYWWAKPIHTLTPQESTAVQQNC